MKLDLEQAQVHVEWLLASGVPGCVQLEQRAGKKTARTWHTGAGSLLAALDPELRNDIGVNLRPLEWAGSAYRDCPAESIQTLTAIRLDIDACRPLCIVTAEAIGRELEADNRQRAEHGKAPLSLPPAAVQAAASCAREEPGLLSGVEEHKATLRGAIRSACAAFDLELRAELLDKLVTLTNRAAAGQPTTDDEHALAISAGKRIAAWAEAQGLGTPLVVDSGNGCHLWFAVEPTPLTSDTRAAAAEGCSALERLVRTEVESEYPTLRVDPWGGFAATTRLAGCLNRKGTSTADRPHRTARIVDGAQRGDGRALAAWLVREGGTIRQQRADDLAKRTAEANERAKQYTGAAGAEPRNFDERAERAIDDQLSRRPLAGAGHTETLAAMLPLAGLLVRLGLPDAADRFAALVRGADPHHWTPRQLQIEIGKALDKARGSNEFGSFKRDMLQADAERGQERESQRQDRRTSSHVQHHADAQHAETTPDDDWGPPADSYFDAADLGDSATVADALEGAVTEATRAGAPAAGAGVVVPAKPAPYAPDMLASTFASAIARSRLRADGKERPIRTPWRTLDDALGGGLWGGLHMIVAGTGVGKTQLTLQIAETAARDGIPIGLVELELDAVQLALRVLTEHETARSARVSWSDAYLGRSNETQLRALDAAALAMKDLPIYVDHGGAMSWSSDRLRKLVEYMRAKHPTGPLLVVVDFLQLVGAPEGESKLELRERIARAAYQARQLAREFGAAIVLVSSTARANYEALSGKLTKLGLRVRKTRFGGTERTMLNVEALIGSGKESGETEYAADSLTVLLRPQLTVGAYDDVIAELFARGGKPIVAAVVKWRAGPATWFALAHEKGRFSDLPNDSINSLVPGESEEAGSPGRPKRDPHSFMRAVVEVVRSAEAAGAPLKNRTAIAARVSGTKSLVVEGTKAALREGYITEAFGEFRTTGKTLPPEPAGDIIEAASQMERA